MGTGRRIRGSKRGQRLLIAVVSTLVVITGVAVVVETSSAMRGNFDVAGDAVASDVDDVDPMKRPSAQEGVNLGKPAAAKSKGERERPPAKAEKTCAEATDFQIDFGIKKGSKVCAPSGTRQSPDLVKARPLVMAEGFEPAPAPAAADDSSDQPSPSPAPGDDGAGSAPDVAPIGPGSKPSSQPEPSEDSVPSLTPSPSGGTRAPPTGTTTGIKPAAARSEARGKSQIVAAAFHPKAVVEPTPGEYLSPNWTKLSPTTTPAGVVEPSLVYDPVRAQFILFGGRNGTGPSNDTWAWTGSDWVKLNPATKPSARYSAASAWDPVQQKIILFGGESSSTTRYNDVWAWNGTTWAQQSPTGTPPSARVSASMAFDPVRGGLVLFGGANLQYNNDTWQLKNNVWTLIQASGAAGAPAARVGAGLAYSQSTSQLVLFGGGTGSCPACPAFSDTWTLGASSSAWTHKAPTHSPSARLSHSMTYDAGIGAVVLFGGIIGDGTTSTFYNDTWAWTGTDWSQAVGIASPSGRAGAAMAADDKGHTLLLGGLGAAVYSETWTYDSSLPLLDVEVSNASGGTTQDPIFWVGDSAKITITAVNAGTQAITGASATSITSALQDTVLAAGTQLTWGTTTNDPNAVAIDPCAGVAGALCGGVSDLTTTISNISIPAGSTRVGDFVASIVGTQRGCELIDIPAITSSITGGSSGISKQITVCGGGLGLENWWTYDTTDLGNGGTASVNAANGNLVVKQYDTPPVQTRGRLAIGLGRAYNSQDLMSGGGPLGAGWQFDIGDTGETAGGFGIAGLKLPNLQTLTQPLSMPYVDRDGTRHVFRLRSVGAAAGDLSLPIDLTAGAGGAVSSLLGGLINLPFNSLLTGNLTNLCIDEAYTGPKGTNMFLFRYIGLGASNGCANPSANSGVELGWSLVRPDRVRYDFNVAGDLIRVTDPAGQQLIYTPGVAYGPTEIYTKACGKNGVCPKVTINYNADPTATDRLVEVVDTAQRKTTYVVSRDALMPELLQVWLPGNPVSTAPGAIASISYAYTAPSPNAGKVRCDGVDQPGQTIGQLCRVTDAQAGKTTIGYTAAPLGPDRVLKVTDRRGNDAANDGTNKGLTTLYTWHDKADGSPDYVTADMGAPAIIGSCGSACQRARYATIDVYGRVGEIDEGSSDDTYLRQAGYFWDGDAIGSCSQPSTAVNHNLCQTIRRAVPRTAPFAPGDVATATVNGVTVHDQATSFQYGELGQLVRQKVLIDAAQAWTDANSSITTYGTKDQYFDANGDQRAYNSHVEGNGVVKSTGSGVNYATAVKRDTPVAYWRLGESPGAGVMASTTGTNNGAYAAGLALGDAGAVPDDTGLLESTSGWGSVVNSLSGFAHGTAAADSDFTVETWQKTTDTGQEYALNWGTTPANGLIGRTYGGKPMISLRSDTATGKEATAYTSASIADGAWHHVVYTYNGNGTTGGMSIWIDGVKASLVVYSDDMAGEFAPASAYTQISVAGPGSHLDELSLFDHVLTDSRIKAHRDAAYGGQRVEADTLYAVTDQVQKLSPRGNNATNWGDYLTTFRRDIPADGSSASTFKVADANGICGANTGGNTGVICETDTPASNGTGAGSCKSPTANLPSGSPAAPTSGGYAFSCTKYEYNNTGQRTIMRTPKATAASDSSAFEYKYYDDTDSCAGAARANCDLSATASSGGWLKSVVDPAGEKTVFAYDAGGNIARTWERNASHGHALTESWSTAGAAPSAKFNDQVNGTPVTSDSLSVSNTALIAVQPDGTVSGSGANSQGELGDGGTSAHPNAVPAKVLTDVVKVSQTGTGAFSSCSFTTFLTGSGDVWFAGSGISTPTRIAGLKDIIDIHSGGCHAMALDANGSLWVWGNNGSGQVGNGSTSYVTTPVKVLDNVSLMTGGYLHSLAVKTDGTLWAWGRNAEGQLGLGNTADQTTPTKVASLADVRGLAAGVNTSYALTRDGKVWAWGDGQNGGLGLGDTNSRNTPTRITTLGQGTAAGIVRQIAAGAYGAAALMADGSVRAWGLNNLGQLGASGANATAPTAVPGVSGQVALAGGWATFAAADKAGKVTVWGGTGNYQRADGTNPASSTPTTAGIDISPYRVPGLQLRGTRDATGNLTTTTYDRLEQPRRVRSGRGNDILSSAFDRMVGYDAAGRPISASGAQHRSTSAVATTAYDSFGNPVRSIDARGVASLATFDAANRQLTTQVTRGDATESPTTCTGTATTAAWTAGQNGQKVCTTSTTWDGVDRQVTITDADSQVTKYLTDAAGRRTGVDVPRNEGAVTYVKARWLLDKDGNATTACSPRQLDATEPAPSGTCVAGGIYSTDYSVDRAGRSASVTAHRGSTDLTTAFGYDADGNTTSVTDANGHETTQTFDLQGRQVTRTVPRSASKSFTTRWTYDYSGNTTAVRAPGSINTGSGADGDLVVDGTLGINSTDGAAHGSGNPFKVPDGAQYRNVTLQNGGYLTSNDANGLAFSATGTVTVCSGCSITMVGKGYAGGAAAQDAANPRPGNGGIKGAGVLLGTASGAGGGAHKNDGAPGISTDANAPAGAGGLKSGTEDFSDVGSTYLRAAGGGGGGGGVGLLGSGGVGGSGGGFMRITANKFVVSGSGTITAAGAAGGNSGANSGGGGGGAGGGIWLVANDINLPATTSVNVAGGAGGAGTNGSNGGAGSPGYLRFDADNITNEPVGAFHGSSTTVTAVSYDAANRPLDTVEGSQTVQADATIDNSEFAAPDANGLSNTRTRSFYDADGAVSAILPPTAFSNAASLTAPNIDVARRVDHDLDGQVARAYAPRFSDAVTSIGAGNDGTTGTNQQTSQCTTGRTVDAVAALGSYGSSVGVCATVSEYDAAGNLSRQWLPTSNGADNKYLDYTYTGDGLTKNVTGPDPNSSGRVTVSTSRYDGTGQPTRVTDALGNYTQTAWTGDDLARQVTAMSYSDGTSTVASVTTYSHDANGNATVVNKPTGDGTKRDATQVWTSDNRVSQITAPGSATGTTAVTKYTYDKVGNPIEVRDPNAVASSTGPVVNEFTFDNMISSTHSPLNASAFRSVKYTYSPAGLKVASEVAKCTSSDTANCVPGNAAWNSAGAMRLTYGANGRLSDQIGRDKSSITTTYTQDGHPKKVTDPTSLVSVTAGYYLDGRVRTVDDGSNANTYAYDGSGQVTVRSDQTPAAGVTGGSKVTTSYGYNAAGLPTSMDSGVLDLSSTYSYDDAGRVDVAATGDHVNDYSWNPDGSLAGVRNAVGSTSVSEFVYKYFDSRDIKSQAVTGSAGAYTNTYGYAPGDQVTSWTKDGVTTTYEYDRNSNRTKAMVGSSTATWAYNRDNSITSATTAAGTKAYSYNNAGLLTTDGCSNTTYDDFDRVSKVQVTLLQSTTTGCSDDPRSTTYAYDGLDRQRTSAVTGSNKSGANVTTKSVFDGLAGTTVGQVDAVNGARTAPEVMYQLDPSGTAMGYEQTGDAAHKAYVDTDGHGNVTNLITTAGDSACSVVYDPYGNGVDATGGTSSNGLCKNGSKATTTGNASWYRGATRDGSVGTYQLGTRTYSPSTGAFTTPDAYRVASPSTDLSVGTDPLTMNTYSYVNGNPINAWDPSGHMWDSWGDAWDDVKGGTSATGHFFAGAGEKVGETVVDTGKMVWSYDKFIYSGEFLTAEGQQKTVDYVNSLGHAATHPKEVWNAAKDDCLKHGDANCAGRVGINVALQFVGIGEAKDALTAARVARLSVEAREAKLAVDAAQAAGHATGIARASEAVGNAASPSKVVPGPKRIQRGEASRSASGSSDVARSSASGGGDAGHKYADQVLPGGRPDGQPVFAGHGVYRYGSGDLVIPEGTVLHVYAEFDRRIGDSVGRSIESGVGPDPVEVFGPGSVMPNYTLTAPDNLAIHAGSVTVEDPTRLSELLHPNMGTCHWAACTEASR